MSATIVAYAILGCEITALVPKEEQVRGCAHAEASAKFCAECGKPMWKTIEVYIDDWASESNLDANLKRVGLGRETTRDRRTFVGRMIEVSGSSDVTARRLPADPFVLTIIEIINSLRELDLYNPETFGFWSVLYYS